ncbi:FKBP-type peptidyl-prolyl isomerase [Talaromyces pinophilus]|uniref:peptidylprolyl isomerase n=1 Tax=Talaromyces pinophilus TaxID=128442 RepID=A0A510NUZ9_TALPI|nr:FKBP-type peptidyl-prolyl isomerase [Talaromyces pinophilus]
MSWRKTILSPGNGTDMPAVGANVKIDYTGWLRDPSNPDHEKGKEFDSSKGRGPLATPIGKGRVIKGWDEGVLSMTLGEEAILTIDSSYAYGDGYVSTMLGQPFPFVIDPKNIPRITPIFSPPPAALGFPGVIPPKADLIFQVKLIEINGKRA